MQTLNRRVLGIGLVTAILLAVLPATSASAATAVGAACSKVGAKTPGVSLKKKVTLTCKKASGQLVWTDTRVVNLSVIANAIQGGKSAANAIWLQDYVIPNYTRDAALRGYTVKVKFTGQGVADEAYKSGIALDLKAKIGADIMNIDGIWVGEFADAGYIKPLLKVVGPTYTKWEGWSQINSSVQDLMSYNGARYGIPQGTDGRILYFNKKIFAAAGLPTNWQPNSWADILAAAKKIKDSGQDGVVPIQIDAGTQMGEATTMQGVLPLLVGTGERIYDPATKKWAGNTAGIRKVLQFYADIYGNSGYGNPTWQLTATGRDDSFQAFADGKVGILGEGDYGWRGVWNPTSGNHPMATRATDIGFAKIPAVAPKAGIRNQSFVSMSGGGGYILNPATKNAAMAWDLLTFMNNRESIQASLNGSVKISQRNDVNTYIAAAAGDACIAYIVKNVMPVTAYRPGLADYPAVSAELQKATEAIVNGTSVTAAAAAYANGVKAIVGAKNVKSN
jgi:multiple sugar transport system substrate-binding protein